MAAMRHAVAANLFLGLLALSCAGGGDFSGPRLALTRPAGIVEHAIESGEERQLVPQGGDVSLLDPAVSPDGSRILFARQLTPIVLPGQTADYGSDILVVDSSGGAGDAVVTHEIRGELLRSPRWLAGGDAFVMSVQLIAGGRVLSTIEGVDVGTGARTVLIDNAFEPDVSRDGERLVFMQPGADFMQALRMANIDGSGPEEIVGPADNLVSFYSPRFSPDGSKIVFGGAEPIVPLMRARSPALVTRAGAALAGTQSALSYNGLPADVWVLDLTTDELVRIGDLDLDQPSLTWSADGTRVYVYSTFGLYELDPTGAEQPELLDEGTFHGYVDWLGE
jgi:Tol biopolymer transport system component